MLPQKACIDQADCCMYPALASKPAELLAMSISCRTTTEECVIDGTGTVLHVADYMAEIQTCAVVSAREAACRSCSASLSDSAARESACEALRSAVSESSARVASWQCRLLTSASCSAACAS